MSSPTSPSSDRPSSSDANGGASAHMSRENTPGADAEKRTMGSSYSGSSGSNYSSSSSDGALQSQGTQSQSTQSQSTQSNAKDQVQETMHDLADQAQQLCHDSMESMKSYIAQHPVSSVGIAMAAGCVLSMMFREQSSMRSHRHH